MNRERVAIQGYDGCFHHIAAQGYYGPEIEILPCATFREVASRLGSGEADTALMAIENSIAGSILPNYAILQNSNLRVVGEIYLQIVQNLLVLPDVELSDIREVWSHPMALLQCADYLDQHPWRLVETEDTALSAAHIARDGVRHAAAIAGELPASLFGLKVIAPAINTIQSNHTRFVVLRRVDDPLALEPVLNPDFPINKASMFFEIGHRRGSLLAVLNTLQRYNINMTKLQSCPVPSDPWHYQFHLDMEFEDMAEYREAVQDMKALSQSLTVYGEYTKGRQI